MEIAIAKSDRHPEYLFRVQFWRAALAALIAGLVLVAGYYATLGLLPSASAWPAADQPFALWAHRLDLAQFFGTIFLPPVPTLLSWWVGLAVWIGALIGGGVGYAILLSWTLGGSSAVKGAGYGVALGIGLLLGLTLAQGFHPAIMRNALPDTGVFMLGWSIWAAIQIVLLFALYGAILGLLYRRWAHSEE